LTVTDSLEVETFFETQCSSHTNFWWREVCLWTTEICRDSCVCQIYIR